MRESLIARGELVRLGKGREARLRILANLVEGIRQPKKSKQTDQQKKPVKDRNLLDKLPECNEDLEKALFECFLMAKRGKTKTMDEYKYDVYWKENQEKLVQDIIHRRWKPSSSKAFVTHRPVDREIFAAMFRDRIVHHLLYAIVAPWWEKRFIYDSYSCRRGKGTDFGVKRMQGMMVAAYTGGNRPGVTRAVSGKEFSLEIKGQRVYVIKGDLSGYFMSLSRRTLYKKVLWGLNKQFPEKGWIYELAKYLWREVIFDDPCTNARIAGTWLEWDNLPHNKSLFHQPVGRGIVIGNLTSQLLSNIMLNEFDWFMKREMKFKWYGRYVDDFFVIVRGCEYEWAMSAIRNEVAGRLAEMGLKMHPKKLYVQEARKGCPFLGRMVKPWVILPGKRYLKNMRSALEGYVEGAVSYDTMQSYIGMAQHMAAYKPIKKVVDSLRADN